MQHRAAQRPIRCYNVASSMHGKSTMNIFNTIKDVNQIIDSYLISNDPVPNAALHEIGDGDFRAIGAEFLDYMVKIGGLTPYNDVLDIGCGFGRIAIPLARYLAPDSRLIGFDIVAEPIDWCTEHVTPLHPGFSFSFIDIMHPLYNTAGSAKSDQGFNARLPEVQKLQPDFAAAISVFTHLDQPSIEHYLADLSAVLRPGGTLFMTLFLTGAAAPQIGAGCVFLQHAWKKHGPLTALMSEPLTAAVGIPLEWLQQQLALNGLLTTKIHYGHWRWGRGQSGPFQDILVCSKPHDA